MADVRSLVAAAEHPMVFCTDWRKLATFPPDLSDTIVWIMRRDNPKIRGNAVLVSADQPGFLREVEDILREAKNESRSVFNSVAALSKWLDPMLTPEERRRRDEFLAAGE